MALQNSGKITLKDIQGEFGGTAPHSLKEYYDAADGVPASGTIGIKDFYGVQDTTVLTSEALVNGKSNRKQITASSFISSGEILEIPANFYVWSDSTSTAALTVDIPCTILNKGFIIGKGGNGAVISVSTATGGGPAINVTSTGVTITNESGAYIAGGGGGGGAGNWQGGGGEQYGTGNRAGGGGGAGGGAGGTGSFPLFNNILAGGSGGALGAAGSSGQSGGGGGGAGGGGSGGGGGGGGGGRILPGTGGAAGSGTNQGGVGGSAGNVGGNHNSGDQYTSAAGGGGGWGARGGLGGATAISGNYDDYGNGGAAITGTSRTLTNNGTIYGTT